MPPEVDVYNTSYGNYERDVYRDVRLETYGEDYGQTSWVSTEESYEIPSLLELTPGCEVLEIGSGSGRYAVYVAETARCNVVGLDVNAEGVRNAGALAERQNLSTQVRFQQRDVSQPLPFTNENFDAVYSNDVFCHIPGRLALLRELWRVLKPGGRMIFSDALVVGGTLSNQEIATRSLIGDYLFVPPGENERLIAAAGFRLLEVTDTTEKAAELAGRWHDAREKRESELIALEGEINFEGLQKFLACVQNLTNEKRLLRLVYRARKLVPNQPIREATSGQQEALARVATNGGDKNCVETGRPVRGEERSAVFFPAANTHSDCERVRFNEESRSKARTGLSALLVQVRSGGFHRLPGEGWWAL